jgi:dynein heavy chain
VESHVIFGDYMKMGATGDDRTYEEIKDLKALSQLLDEYLFEYNMTNPVQMNLVFFRDAIEHISRCARVCRLEKGNAMLVGVGGSGKQSVTRLASSMLEYKCFSIELKKGYDIVAFRDDIKKLFEMTGVEGKSVTFLLVDTQIVVESMLEDVNNILNTGEVPGMYPDDEKAKICSDMIPVCDALGVPADKTNCWNTFVRQCQNNLHIVLCMSPVGEAFRNRCRLFPALINCTTIDWFTPWPDEVRVARTNTSRCIRAGVNTTRLPRRRCSPSRRSCSSRRTSARTSSSRTSRRCASTCTRARSRLRTSTSRSSAGTTTSRRSRTSTSSASTSTR